MAVTSIIIVSFTLIGNSDEAQAFIFIKIDDLKGGVTTPGYEGYFSLESFSFEIERRMSEVKKELEKQNDNIGLGELQEIKIEKLIDGSSTKIAQHAINGNSLGSIEIEFVEIAENRVPYTYLKYKLDEVFVKSWRISGDEDERPTEEVELYYKKIAFVYIPTIKKLVPNNPAILSWDNEKNLPWNDHNLENNLSN